MFQFKKIIIFLLTLCTLILFNVHEIIINNVILYTFDIKCNTLISDVYIDVPYYLVYENISFYFTRINFWLSNMPDNLDIKEGRWPNNSNEIIVSSEYGSLLGRTIKVNILSNQYYFKVVGIYQNDILLPNFVYANEDTFKLFYEDNILDSYNYIFFIDNYKTLNKEIDRLKKNNYDISINSTSNLIKNDIYDILNNTCIILSFTLCTLIIFLSLQLLSFNISLN